METLSASRIGRINACPASANLEKALPGWTPPVVDPTAGAKGRGTELHKVLEIAATEPASQLQHLVKAIEYVATLKSRRRFKILTEATLPATWLSTTPSTTVDLVLYVADELHIVDHKTGRIHVDAEYNQQLMFYALAVIDHLGSKVSEVHLHINQPWADNQSVWVVPRADLEAFRMQTIATEQKVLAGDTTFGPSDHCTFCPANPRGFGDRGHPLCPALLELYYPDNTDMKGILDV